MPRSAEVVLRHRPADWEPPLPREGWPPSVQRAWDVYWESDISRITEQVDYPALVRLFDLYHEYELLAEVKRRAGPMSRGSTGQWRTAPWADRMLSIEPAISRLEALFGLTPVARISLGVAFGKLRVLDSLQGEIVDYGLSDFGDHEIEEMLGVDDAL